MQLSIQLLEARVVPSFISPRNYDAGPSPYAVAVGDFNGDGIPDLAVADFGDASGIGGGVSVLQGKGDGSFQAPLSIASVNLGVGVATGDFNGDGIPDLAVVAQASNVVTVLLGNGDDTFQNAGSFAAGSAVNFVAVADLTSNGIADLIVTSAGTEMVSVLQGKGDGSFQPARTYPIGTSPDAVAVGDFNGDGIPDLAFVGPFGANVTIVLGNGDGTFQPPRTLDVGGRGSFFSIAVAHFRHNGISDLAVADYDSGAVRVLLGNGDGTFQPAVTYAAGRGCEGVVVGDFNGDGIPDLAVANLQSNTVSVLLGKGDGTFQPAVTYAAGSQPESLAVGDVNDDGTPDLIVNGDGGTRVLLGDGDGTFQTSDISYSTGSHATESVAIGDFTGNGLPDVAALGPRNLDSVILLQNDGTWNGPAPRRGHAAGMHLEPFRAALALPEIQDVRSPETAPIADSPLKAAPHLPLLDSVRPTLHGLPTPSVPHILTRSRHIQYAFFMDGIFDFSE